MPELPDVEGFRRTVRLAAGRRITAVDVRDPGVLRNRSGSTFSEQLVGQRFGEPQRHGKWLLAPTSGPTLLFHFGMTGRLVWSTSTAGDVPFARVAIEVGPDTLVFADQRKLRGIWLVEDDDALRRVTGPLGPDALGMTTSGLAARMAGRRQGLKTLLMDQRVVAGLGNMLSDEVLWRARLHPARTSGQLDADERRRLGRALQGVLRASVEAGEIPRRASWLSSQRNASAPRCPRCHGDIRRRRFDGRTAYWCAACQPAAFETT